MKTRLSEIHRRVMRAGRTVNDAITFRRLRKRAMTEAAAELEGAAAAIRKLLEDATRGNGKERS